MLSSPSSCSTRCSCNISHPQKLACLNPPEWKTFHSGKLTYLNNHMPVLILLSKEVVLGWGIPGMTCQPGGCAFSCWVRDYDLIVVPRFLSEAGGIEPCGIVFAVQREEVKASDCVKTWAVLKSYFPTSGVLGTDTGGGQRPCLLMKPTSSPAENMSLLVSPGASSSGLTCECHCTNQLPLSCLDFLICCFCRIRWWLRYHLSAIRELPALFRSTSMSATEREREASTSFSPIFLLMVTKYIPYLC